MGQGVNEMSWTKDEVKEATVKVLEKAKQDEKFRALVLSDVYAAVKEVTGREVPREFKINVIDGSGYHSTIVLPPIRKEKDELTDTELEVVAGGGKFDEGVKDLAIGIGDGFIDCFK
jgi:hypothetical protein